MQTQHAQPLHHPTLPGNCLVLYFVQAQCVPNQSLPPAPTPDLSWPPQRALVKYVTYLSILSPLPNPPQPNKGLDLLTMEP